MTGAGADGAVLALATKSAIATLLGTTLRRYFARNAIRVVAASACCVLAILAALRID